VKRNPEPIWKLEKSWFSAVRGVPLCGISGAALSVSLNALLGKAFGETPKVACETQALP
jgi:hypothetical protein